MDPETKEERCTWIKHTPNGMTAYRVECLSELRPLIQKGTAGELYHWCPFCGNRIQEVPA